MVFNGIWQVGHGFQVSALHFFAAGIRLAHTYGGDVRGTGANFSQRLRPDGTIVPRNDLIAPAQNRTDIRFQQKIPLGGRGSFDLIAEVFNAFNRPNWGIGTQESTPDAVPAAHDGAGAHGAVRLQTDLLGSQLPNFKFNSKEPSDRNEALGVGLGSFHLGVLRIRPPFPYRQMSSEVPSWP